MIGKLGMRKIFVPNIEYHFPLKVMTEINVGLAKGRHSVLDQSIYSWSLLWKNSLLSRDTIRGPATQPILTDSIWLFICPILYWFIRDPHYTYSAIRIPSLLHARQSGVSTTSCAKMPHAIPARACDIGNGKK